VLELLEMDTSRIPSTKASDVEQQMFVALILEALAELAERVPKKPKREAAK
jgi:hypothetical protein